MATFFSGLPSEQRFHILGAALRFLLCVSVVQSVDNYFHHHYYFIEGLQTLVGRF
jgi:hypothetical protein